MKIAIQGIAGSFHDQATKNYFKLDDYQLVACPTFEDVFLQAKNGAVDYGVVAVENSLYGSIHETYDQLVRHKLNIVGEIQLEIHQQFIAHKQAQATDITEIISHPAAIDQCRQYIHDNFPKAQIIEHDDTAGAVKDIAESNNVHQAAIASEISARLYGMNILRANIEDEPDNITRFIIISSTKTTAPDADKSTLILTTDHSTGSLFKALQVFNDHGCNLTKIESRHVRGQPYRYQFIIDVMSSPTTLLSITDQLARQNCQSQVLGHYKANI